MSYISSTWTQQSYPANKNWLWYKCEQFPGVDLYVTKDKKRGALRLPSMQVLQVVVQEIDDQITIVGEAMKPLINGSKAKPWMMYLESIPKHKLNWLNNQEYPYHKEG